MLLCRATCTPAYTRHATIDTAHRIPRGRNKSFCSRKSLSSPQRTGTKKAPSKVQPRRAERLKLQIYHQHHPHISSSVDFVCKSKCVTSNKNCRVKQKQTKDVQDSNIILPLGSSNCKDTHLKFSISIVFKVQTIAFALRHWQNL